MHTNKIYPVLTCKSSPDLTGHRYEQRMFRRNIFQFRTRAYILLFDLCESKVHSLHARHWGERADIRHRRPDNATTKKIYSPFNNTLIQILSYLLSVTFKNIHLAE
jgi:hypothetical protein